MSIYEKFEDKALADRLKKAEFCIRKEHARGLKQNLATYFKLGKYLAHVQQLDVNRGLFDEWLEQFECQFSRSSAYNYMALWKVWQGCQKELCDKSTPNFGSAALIHLATNSGQHAVSARAQALAYWRLGNPVSKKLAMDVALLCENAKGDDLALLFEGVEGYDHLWREPTEAPEPPETPAKESTPRKQSTSKNVSQAATGVASDEETGQTVAISGFAGSEEQPDEDSDPETVSIGGIELAQDDVDMLTALIQQHGGEAIGKVVREISGEPEQKKAEAPSKGPSSTAPPSLTKRMQRPTVEQVKEYFTELDEPASEGEAFHDHFTSNGWKVGGRAPMKDWKASVRNWIRSKANRFSEAKPTQEATGSPPPPISYESKRVVRT